MIDGEITLHVKGDEDVAMVLAAGCMALAMLIRERPDGAVETVRQLLKDLPKEQAYELANGIAHTIANKFLELQENPELLQEADDEDE